MKQNSKFTKDKNHSTKRRVSNSGKKGKRGRDENYTKTFDPNTATNDPNWYATDPSLLRDAASIPFSWAVGSQIRLHNPLSPTAEFDTFSVPGICAIELYPSCGYSNEPTDPVNVAATAQYTFVRHMNSGHANYDSPDLMLYTLAMSQVYSYINHLQRIYGTATLYAQRNRYLPTALLTAMGCDPSDIQTNLADFRYGINVLINKAASMAVPANMTIFQRHASMYQNIYSEGTSVKDQLYMYVPKAFWKFEWDATDMSGRLASVDVPTNATVLQLLDYGTDMLNRIIRSEDMNIMSGDIKKAFGEGGLVKLTSLPSDYPIVPIFDVAVLEQMKNATLVGTVHGDSNDVTQDSTHGYLIHTPQAVRSISTDTPPSEEWARNANLRALETLMEYRLLTTNSQEPSPELVIDSTRLMAVARDYVKNSESLATVALYTGSEVASRAVYYYYAFDTSSKEWKLFSKKASYVFPIFEQGDTVMIERIGTITLASCFKFHPAHHLITFRPGTAEGTFQMGNTRLMYDIDNYAVLSTEDLEKMHEAALMNELHVPSVAKFR